MFRSSRIQTGRWFDEAPYAYTTPEYFRFSSSMELGVT